MLKPLLKRLCTHSFQPFPVTVQLWGHDELGNDVYTQPFSGHIDSIRSCNGAISLGFVPDEPNDPPLRLIARDRWSTRGNPRYRWCPPALPERLLERALVPPETRCCSPGSSPPKSCPSL